MYLPESVARICWGLDGVYNVALVKVIPQKAYYREFLRSYLKSEFFQKLHIGMSGMYISGFMAGTRIIG